MHIESIEEIEEIRLSFSAKFKLTLSWSDQRLAFNNLNREMFLNLPNTWEKHKIWIPVLIFQNTETNYETVLDPQARIYINRSGNYTLSSEFETDEIAKYKGSENSINYIRTFYHRFKCDFQLHNFPFDTQVCQILLRMPQKQKKFLKYNPNGLQYSGNKDIEKFYVSSVKIDKGKKNSKSDVEVRIIMKRRIGKHLLSTYLPSFCILMSAQVTDLFLTTFSIFCYFRLGCILKRSTSRQLYLSPLLPCWSCIHSRLL